MAFMLNPRWSSGRDSSSAFAFLPMASDASSTFLLPTSGEAWTHVGRFPLCGVVGIRFRASAQGYLPEPDTCYGSVFRNRFEGLIYHIDLALDVVARDADDYAEAGFFKAFE